ncbi:MAG: N-acetylmuramoyl-L-alanine amidase [Vicinamibacterales bacterium]
MPRACSILLFRITLPVVVLTIALSAQVATPSLTVLSREGRRTLEVVSVNNQDYVALDEVAAAFGAVVRDDRLAGGVTVTVGDRTMVLTSDQTVVSVAGRLVSLPSAPRRQGNRWLVPIDFLPRALAPMLNTRLDLRRAARLLVVGDLRVPRVVARVDAGNANAAVTFEITPATPARVIPATGSLEVEFEADAVELSLPPLPTQPFVQSVVAGATPTTVRISTGPRFATFRSSSSQVDATSSRLTIELLPSGAESVAVVPPVAVAPSPELPAPLAPPPPVGVRTVVLDPGHGGEEVGAQGTRGGVEKDVTLSIARRLRTLIESRLGLRVFLTRDDDRGMTLDERTAFANSHKADVFLSLHANAALRPAMKGAEVYYLSAERGESEGPRVMDLDTSSLPVLGGGTRSIDLILWDVAQTRYLEQSSGLAGFVEQALRIKVEMSPRAVQQAPFRVLVGANMPAVLIEMGYLSNPDQEAALVSAEYQTRMVEALLDGLVRYRDFVERTPVTAAGLPPRPPP